MLIRCTLKDEKEVYQIKPFPGGLMARQAGCLCPHQPNPAGEVTFDSECPVHQLEKVTQQ